MKPRRESELDVHRGTRRAAVLTRTTLGASLVYDADYAVEHRGDPLAAVSFTLPVRAQPYDVNGVNLHPFFAGLLPEGLRVRALVRAIKTSEDDLFSLLAAVGEDAIGDVAVTARGKVPRERASEVDAGELGVTPFREVLEQSLAFAGTGPYGAIAGVQPKVSPAMISVPLKKRGSRSSYLLKLSPPEFPRLVENEAFFMALARAVGLETANVELVRDSTGECGLLVERFDRRAREDGTLERLHQEDACQLLGRYPADKYRLKLQDVGEALDACSAPLVERLKLLRLQALAYLIVNGDMHAKNVSVLTRDGTVALTPVHDMLSTLSYGDRKLALSMEGRDDRLQAKHFIAFGERLDVRSAATTRMLGSLVKRIAPWIERLSEIGLEAKQTLHLERLMRERSEALDP
ncbi:MAG: HipA domain-containing protein [Planctomycetota bacterium]|nr:HipA domain-containing protein [Planctomycetota bacterium]